MEGVGGSKEQWRLWKLKFALHGFVFLRGFLVIVALNYETTLDYFVDWSGFRATIAVAGYASASVVQPDALFSVVCLCILNVVNTISCK